MDSTFIREMRVLRRNNERKGEYVGKEMYGGNLFKFGSTGLFLGSLTNLPLDLYKGQLISEGLFGVIVWTKKNYEIF